MIHYTAQNLTPNSPVQLGTQSNQGPKPGKAIHKISTVPASGVASGWVHQHVAQLFLYMIILSETQAAITAMHD